MTSNELAAFIDQTLLKPDSKEADYRGFFERSLNYDFASICIPPHYVNLAAEIYAGNRSNICTVVGFPLGYASSESKVFEAKKAFEEGVKEIDMVANISMIKSNKLDYVTDEIGRVVSAVPGAIVKVIIECCYLSDVEKVAACKAVIKGGGHFVKTSTGFGSWGAKVEDVKLLSTQSNGRIKVKAAGGIKTLSDALQMIEAGADRIGTSSGIEIIEAL